MLIKASQEISRISDDSAINSENYLESITYIDSLFKCIDLLKGIFPSEHIKFLPTFKGKYTCEKFGIISNEKENTMKFFKIQSALFLEDDGKKLIDIYNTFGDECESAVIEGDILYLTLK